MRIRFVAGVAKLEMAPSTAEESPLQRRLRLSPTQVMYIIAAVDAADAALVTGSLPQFETWLKLSPAQLGTLMMLQSAAGSVTLPMWGYLLRSVGYKRLLLWAVACWAASTILTTWCPNFLSQCVLRIVNGGSLSCVMPLAQSLLAEVTAETARGSAFGLFASIERVSGLAVGYAVVSSGYRWRECYYCVFGATLVLLALIALCLPERFGQQATGVRHGRSFVASLRSVVCIPTFGVMVAQGIMGATPWRALAFLNLLWQKSGFTNTQAASIGAFSQLGAVCGALVGGLVGDCVARKFPFSGRIAVSQLSILAGIPLWTAWLHVDTSTRLAVAYGFVFYFFACWPGVAACRPICAELVAEPMDRANIVAVWAFLEGAAASVFGGPIVGILAEFYGYKLVPNMLSGDTGQLGDDRLHAQALRRALINIGCLTWGVCVVVWTLMYITFPRDVAAARRAIPRSLASSRVGSPDPGLGIFDVETRLLRDE